MDDTYFREDHQARRMAQMVQFGPTLTIGASQKKEKMKRYSKELVSSPQSPCVVDELAACADILPDVISVAKEVSSAFSKFDLESPPGRALRCLGSPRLPGEAAELWQSCDS